MLVVASFHRQELEVVFIFQQFPGQIVLWSRKGGVEISDSSSLMTKKIGCYLVFKPTAAPSFMGYSLNVEERFVKRFALYDVPMELSPKF